MLKRNNPENLNKFYVSIFIIFIIILFLIINIKPNFAQSSGRDGNIIAAVYSSDPSHTSDIKVYQNYPNPFSSTTTIKFEIASFSNLKLSVYDNNGNLVKAYLYDNIKPGIHEINIDGSDFPAGEYYYRFISGNYSQTYKMSVLK
jgi:hypothetical protein